jgi:hypothetical protein
MLIVNFSHPLTADQVTRIEVLAGQSVERVIDAPAQFDNASPFLPQVVALVDSVGLDPAAWQTTPLVVVPPALSFISVALLAELHGRMGYFPTCARLRPVAESAPPKFEVAELLPLNEMREAARRRR